MRILLILLSSIFLLTVALNAQNEDVSLVGSWGFEELTDLPTTMDNGEPLDSIGKAMMQMMSKMFEGTSFTFYTNGEYKVNGMMQDFGYWELKEEMQLEFMSNKGSIDIANFEILDDNRLKLSIAKSDLLLVKSGEELLQEENLIKSFDKKTNYQENQLSGKWQLVKRHKNFDKPISDLVKEAVDLVNSSVNITLSQENRVSYNALGIESKGNWTIIKKNGSQFLIFDYDDESGKPFWRLIEITDTELFMKKGFSDELWHFTNKTD